MGEGSGAGGATREAEVAVLGASVGGLQRQFFPGAAYPRTIKGQRVMANGAICSVSVCVCLRARQLNRHGGVLWCCGILRVFVFLVPCADSWLALALAYSPVPCQVDLTLDSTGV